MSITSHEEWLRRVSPALFEPCERCGIEARHHDDVPTCEGFYVNPMKLGVTRHGEGDELFRHLGSV